MRLLFKADRHGADTNYPVNNPHGRKMEARLVYVSLLSGILTSSGDGTCMHMDSPAILHGLTKSAC